MFTLLCWDCCMLVCLVRWRMDNKHNISPYYQFSASILYEGKAKLVEGNNRHSAHWKQSQFCRVYAYCWFVMYIKRLKGDCCCKCGSEQTADLWRTGQSSGLTCPFTCNLECLILNDHHIIFFIIYEAIISLNTSWLKKHTHNIRTPRASEYTYSAIVDSLTQHFGQNPTHKRVRQPLSRFER